MCTALAKQMPYLKPVLECILFIIGSMFIICCLSDYSHKLCFESPGINVARQHSCDKIMKAAV